MTDRQISTFQQTILEYYWTRGRYDLPWRLEGSNGSFDPYRVLVSELMLQQTQVPRVVPKFESFIRQFPTFEALAAASLAEVLKAWSGLGYNRRAKFLWQAATAVIQHHHGQLPRARDELVRLPGVGPNTAGALLAYAFNQPVVFIETNIRTVFIYHFFSGKQQVSDKAIADLLAKTLPDNPRQWYWALMDYGTHLKQTVGNLNKLSKHYTRQTAFSGSRRQVRGQLLRVLAEGKQTFLEILTTIPDERTQSVLEDLLREELVTKTGETYNLAGA